MNLVYKNVVNEHSNRYFDSAGIKSGVYQKS